MNKKLKLRNDLNADALFSQVRSGFEEIPDHRSKNSMISLPDALMSGFAMFSLKFGYRFDSMEDIFKALFYGFKREHLVILEDLLPS
ncbi:MAG TPA: hypothetical protein VMW53_09130 [archaeon]|nr:hypothetical protein [archaeon]